MLIMRSCTTATNNKKSKGGSSSSSGSATISMGISLPREMVYRIDGERGDVPPSSFILRKLEQVYLFRTKVNASKSENENSSSSNVPLITSGCNGRRLSEHPMSEEEEEEEEAISPSFGPQLNEEIKDPAISLLEEYYRHYLDRSSKSCNRAATHLSNLNMQYYPSCLVKLSQGWIKQKNDN